MALIKCPECGGTVSDKALSCPHCGFPVSTVISDQETVIVANEHTKEENEMDIVSNVSNQESMNVDSHEGPNDSTLNHDDARTQLHRLGSEIDDFHNWVDNNQPPKEFRSGITLGQAVLSQMGLLGAVGAFLFLRPRYTKLLEQPYYKNMTFEDMVADICEKTDQMVALGKECQEELDRDDPDYYNTSTYIAEHCTLYALDWFDFFYQPATQKVTIGEKNLPYSLHVFNRVKEAVSSLDLTEESLKLLKELS